MTKPITVSPLQAQALQSIIDKASGIEKAQTAMRILKAHPDPVVAECAGMLSHPISDWIIAQDREMLALTTDGVDDIQVELPEGDRVAIIVPRASIRIDSRYLGPRLEITRSADGWSAAPPNQDRWSLNGESVEPKITRTVVAGDVIDFGQVRATLVKAGDQ